MRISDWSSDVCSSDLVYGESSLGDWTLRVADTAAGTSGTLEEWSLSLFGGAQTVDDRYVYTDQYAALSADDASRAVLADTDGGTDTINASAVSGSVRIRSEEHTSELQSLMRISYAVFC